MSVQTSEWRNGTLTIFFFICSTWWREVTIRSFLPKEISLQRAIHSSLTFCSTLSGKISEKMTLSQPSHWKHWSSCSEMKFSICTVNSFVVFSALPPCWYFIFLIGQNAWNVTTVTWISIAFLLKVEPTSVAMSVIGQCQTSAILLNNQNARFNNGSTIDMLSLIMG